MFVEWQNSFMVLVNSAVMLESFGNLSVFVSSVFHPLCVPSLVVHGMLVQLVLADFGVSHRLSAVAEDSGPSAISAAGREGTSLLGERRLCVSKR